MLRKPLAALAIFAFVLPSAVHAASTTLERIAESGTFRIGYVPDAAPLSFNNGDGDPAGYSIDLCRYIAVAVRNLTFPALPVKRPNPCIVVNRIAFDVFDQLDVARTRVDGSDAPTGDARFGRKYVSEGVEQRIDHEARPVAQV